MKTRFDVIGNSYEKALALYPDARTDAEWLISSLEIDPSDKVLEFTAGTGYLTNKLAPMLATGELLAQDISSVMLNINKSKCSRYDNVSFYTENNMDLPQVKAGYYNKAVCLGGFHHIEDQVSIMRAIRNKLSNEGIVCIGDFSDFSPVQRYFDERVNNLTDTGHFGLFLSISRMVNLGRVAGFSKCEAVHKKIPFVFQDKDEIGEFYQLVHALNQDPKETANDVLKYFEVIETSGLLGVIMDYIYARYTI